MSMSRMKAAFAAFVLVTAISALAPSASATAKGVVIASGSSALWQTMALAAYNSGQCAVPKKGVTCSHYTDNTKFQLHDNRPGRRVKGTADAVDTGDIWIVFDSTLGPNVWAYIKVDSVVGNRCFFANPACTIQAPSATYNWGSAGQKIAATLWGADTTVVPASVQTLFVNGKGVKVNTAGTDIRPEDAAFAECRVNSSLGNGSPGFGDGLDGLGYNSSNAAGVCPAYGGLHGTNAPLYSTAGIISGYGSTGAASPANILAFNISGKDPFTNANVINYTVVSAGASPITFIYSRNTASSGLNQGTGTTGLSASSDSLQTLFSGTDCDAFDIFGVGVSPNPIYAYLREPLSGTMNTTEATVFRRPVQTISSNGVTASKSQEKNVGSANPLKQAACANGIGGRSRAIGTGEEVNSVLNSEAIPAIGVDGVGYTFFSFGNVGAVAGTANYGYILLDGVDPIGPFNTATKTLFPNQELPTCTAPCTENQFWSPVSSQSYSFPNLRNGKYGAWSLLRMVTTTANATNLKNLMNGSHVYVTNATPDYVPALGVPLNCVGSACTDPGLQVFRAHYQQCNGNGTSATCPGVDGLGPAAADGTFNTNNNPTGTDKGGDMGGCVGAISGGAFGVASGTIQIGIDKDVNGTTGTTNVSCSAAPDRN
jgi:hypothetical protein